MTRRPFLNIRTSGFDGDPCITAMWCDSAEYPDPAWVGHAVSQTVDGAFACLAARSAIRAQPASGDLLRSVLGELAERPGLIDRAALRCEHFAKGSEEDAANLYEMGVPRWTTANNHNERYLSLSARIRSLFNTKV